MTPPRAAERSAPPAAPRETAAAVTLPRTGAPPLRLRARCVHSVASEPGPDPLVEIRLWRREGAPGWAVSAEWRLADGRRGGDAWLAQDFAAAAEALEGFAPRPPRPRPARRDPVGRLAEALAARRLLRAAEIAVGEALAAWAPLTSPGGTGHPPPTP